MKRGSWVIATAVAAGLGTFVGAAEKPAAPPATAPAAPAVLPGNGLAGHDFMYAGESRDRKIFIVRGGKVAWSYDDPKGTGEISDAALLADGNVLFAHQFAVELISPEKKVLWKYDAPKGCEVHTAMPVGKTHVLFVQNGPEPFLRVVNLATGETARQFPLPVKNPKSTHGQFRHARLTPAGTVMVAHMDMGKVCEYDATGKELWSVPAPGCWGVTPLANGNVLVTDRAGVHEIDRGRKTVWEVTRADLPNYQLPNLQLAWRLPNGNTLLNVWVNEWSGKIDKAAAPVQALEVTPEKKVVWALRAWGPPVDLGPATTIQVLDQPTVPEYTTFGDFK
jgi:outer membrane protein assembly factor BamB